jgi:uncharacterized SAM-binding protein YcdF (DUF218 family)
MKKTRRPIPRPVKIALRVALTFCAAAFLCAAVASVQILTCYFDEDAPEGAAALVLGCGLSPADRTAPSLMLAGRLDAAARYLEAHPDAVCVVSGGQGPDERVSEARAMYTYLTARGLAPERLFLEEQSTSTMENLTFSRALMAENGLPTDSVVTVTDGFHQFRAHSIAKSLGMTAYSVSAHAPLPYVLKFWAREIAGIILQVWF